MIKAGLNARVFRMALEGIRLLGTILERHPTNKPLFCSPHSATRCLSVLHIGIQHWDQPGWLEVTAIAIRAVASLFRFDGELFGEEPLKCLLQSSASAFAVTAANHDEVGLATRTAFTSLLYRTTKMISQVRMKNDRSFEEGIELLWDIFISSGVMHWRSLGDKATREWSNIFNGLELLLGFKHRSIIPKELAQMSMIQEARQMQNHCRMILERTDQALIDTEDLHNAIKSGAQFSGALCTHIATDGPFSMRLVATDPTELKSLLTYFLQDDAGGLSDWLGVLSGNPLQTNTFVATVIVGCIFLYGTIDMKHKQLLKHSLKIWATHCPELSELPPSLFRIILIIYSEVYSSFEISDKHRALSESLEKLLCQINQEQLSIELPYGRSKFFIWLVEHNPKPWGPTLLGKLLNDAYHGDWLSGWDMSSSSAVHRDITLSLKANSGVLVLLDLIRIPEIPLVVKAKAMALLVHVIQRKELSNMQPGICKATFAAVFEVIDEYSISNTCSDRNFSITTDILLEQALCVATELQAIKCNNIVEATEVRLVELCTQWICEQTAICKSEVLDPLRIPITACLRHLQVNLYQANWSGNTQIMRGLRSNSSDLLKALVKLAQGLSSERSSAMITLAAIFAAPPSVINMSNDMMFSSLPSSSQVLSSRKLLQTLRIGSEFEQLCVVLLFAGCFFNTLKTIESCGNFIVELDGGLRINSIEFENSSDSEAFREAAQELLTILQNLIVANPGRPILQFSVISCIDGLLQLANKVKVKVLETRWTIIAVGLLSRAASASMHPSAETAVAVHFVACLLRNNSNFCWTLILSHCQLIATALKTGISTYEMIGFGSGDNRTCYNGIVDIREDINEICRYIENTNPRENDWNSQLSNLREAAKDCKINIQTMRPVEYHMVFLPLVGHSN